MKSNRNRGIELLTAESPSTSPKRDEQQDSIQVVGKVLLVSDDRLLVSEPAVFSQNTKIIWNQSSQEREDFVYQSSRKNSNSSLNLAASQDSSTDSSSIVAHSKRFTKERRLKDPTNSRRYRKSIDYIDYSDQSPPLYGSIPRYETLKKSKSLRQARAAKSNTSSNEITPINSDIDAERQPLISDLKSIPVDASTKSRSRMKKLVYSLMALLLLILSVAPIIFFVTQPLELSQQLEVTRVLGTPRLFEFTTKLRAKNRNMYSNLI